MPQSFVDTVRKALYAEVDDSDLKALPGHHDVMCARSDPSDLLYYREQSCSCAKCLKLKWNQCKEKGKGPFCPHEIGRIEA